MRFKKIFLLLCLVICLFSMASVCASDSNDTAIGSDNKLEIDQATDDVIGVEENADLAFSDTNEILNAVEQTFVQLNKTINENDEKVIYLNDDYKYSNGDDSFKDGIDITRDVTIYGKGHTIDGSKQAGIFNVKSKNVIFIDVCFQNSGRTAIVGGGYAINCTFKQNTGEDGGAINGGYAINCTFIGNLAIDGGAIYNGFAQGCNFTGNLATRNGGATYGSSVTICNFIQNNAIHDGGAVYNGNAENSTFSDNLAGNNGGAICNGNATGSNFDSNAANDGGAICNGNSLGSNFTGNIATRDGGAICDGGPFNCIFTNNHAMFGGAVAYGYIENCIFTANNAVKTIISGKEIGGDGGAIYRCNVSLSTFSDNSADHYGGAISWGDAFDCIFTNNHENGVSGAIYRGKATLCTFEDGQFNPNEATIVPVNLTVSDTVVGYNSGEKLRFYLVGDGKIYGLPFNTTIRVYENGTLIGTYYAMNGDGGGEWIVTLEKGDYDVLLSVDNVSGVNNASAKLRVITATTLKANDFNTTYNHDGFLQATLIYDDGKSAAGANMAVNLNGKVKIYTADKNGRIRISTKALSAGTHAAVIRFAGNDEYAKSSITVNITVSKTSTKLNANAIKVVYNANGYLTVTLKDNEGNPISGASITVNLKGVKKLKTDKNGKIKVSTKGLVPKTYTAKITFKGNNNCLKSSKDVKVTVKKATPKLTAKKKTFKKSVKTKKYTVTLKTNRNKALSKVKVTLKVKGKTLTAKTNSKGKATFKIKNLKKKGKVTATVKFAGNKYYKAVTKKVKITVK